MIVSRERAERIIKANEDLKAGDVVKFVGQIERSVNIGPIIGKTYVVKSYDKKTCRLVLVTNEFDVDYVRFGYGYINVFERVSKKEFIAYKPKNKPRRL